MPHAADCLCPPCRYRRGESRGQTPQLCVRLRADIRDWIASQEGGARPYLEALVTRDSAWLLHQAERVKSVSLEDVEHLRKLERSLELARARVELPCLEHELARRRRDPGAREEVAAIKRRIAELEQLAAPRPAPRSPRPPAGRRLITDEPPPRPQITERYEGWCRRLSSKKRHYLCEGKLLCGYHQDLLDAQLEDRPLPGHKPDAFVPDPLAWQKPSECCRICREHLVAKRRQEQV